jgi:hypothetical protein
MRTSNFETRLKMKPVRARSGEAQRPSHCGLAGPVMRTLAAVLLSLCLCGRALARDQGDKGGESADAATTLPNIYLDLKTTYATFPSDVLSIGFDNPPELWETLATLTSPEDPVLPASRGVAVDAPLTIDLNDRLSVYAGVNGSASQIGEAPWTSFEIEDWNAGFHAEAYQQNGGAIPTITVQATLTRSIPGAPLATTELTTITEANYALNEDETRGLLAGVEYTGIAVDIPSASINPDITGYVGAYYQWENNWKLTGRFGVQSFGGAQLVNFAPFRPFTQPVMRIDVDRMDDHDNRLFGVAVQIAWMPKPSYELTVRTPLYAVRNSGNDN